MTFIKNLFSKKKSYAKYGEILKRTLSTKDQRMEAIEILEKQPAETAVPELLKRFELVIDSGLQDIKEKEMVLNVIIKYGDPAKNFVSSYIQSKRRLAWVLKIAEKIFSKKEYLDLLLQNLEFNIIEFDDDARERNLDILHALKETKDPAIIDKVAQFLESHDDDTQMAALDCLEILAEHNEKAKKIILKLAENKTHDMNSRLMGVLTQIINKHNW